ncbi:hypothetical protein Stsp01_66270 [Streptomyces sp. NBRC 13847]|nr:hypothetical protein Stsp01_66270 [Streptomyces sp. NBRC 13847]
MPEWLSFALSEHIHSLSRIKAGHAPTKVTDFPSKVTCRRGEGIPPTEHHSSVADTGLGGTVGPKGCVGSWKGRRNRRRGRQDRVAPACAPAPRPLRPPRGSVRLPTMGGKAWDSRTPVHSLYRAAPRHEQVRSSITHLPIARRRAEGASGCPQERKKATEQPGAC